MAFVLDCDGDFAVQKSGSRFAVIHPLGFDDEEDELYFLFVSIEPHAGGEHELTFFIVVEDEAGNEIDVHKSGLHSRKIKGQDRATVLNFIVTATEILVNYANPPTIYYCVVDDDPPKKALLKYRAIYDLLVLLGYRGRRFDSFYRGHYVWRLER